MSIDLYPLTIRGPINPAQNRSGVVTFARLFEFEGSLYLATSRNKGRHIESVFEYELPDSPPTQPGKAAVWGDFVYTGCGCVNYWNQHTAASLAAIAVRLERPEAVEELDQANDTTGAEWGEDELVTADEVDDLMARAEAGALRDE